MGVVEVGSWVAFSHRRHPRLVGLVAQVCGSSEDREVRVWCPQLTEVVPVRPSAIIEEVPAVPPGPRRVSADGS